MIRNFKSRLTELRETGEIKTGRQIAEAQKSKVQCKLFPEDSREDNTAFGNCYFREKQFPLEYQHGIYKLSGSLTCCGPELVLPTRDKRLEFFDPRDSIFLDIETTGLSGGTGTLAFLIGLGWFEGDLFLLRQYFLRRPAEERAVLTHFAELTSNFSTIVTFNGKMFDLPLIQTRQLLAGLKNTEPPLHLDLLQCARAFWKKRFPSRSLKSLEETLLGLKRLDDIPGAEIPSVYFEFLRRGNTDRLKQVFHHNVLDILSMVTLLERVSRLSAGQLIEHPAEEFALGKLCIESGRTAEGISYLNKASISAHETLASEAALELAFYHKRMGDWLEAVTIWQRMIDNHSVNPLPYVEMAKHMEHRSKQYKSALEMALRALEISRLFPDRYTSGELSITALQHRIRRLKARLFR
ncbi:MAG: ribonuclease H-like domain-containing protein [Bacillota bacterium]|nr:ribonuclease H-like domain-containing protein [Bacillota bacterium]